MITMRGIRKVYRSNLLAMEALRDFELTIDDGEFVAIMGPSGSGKTTFLNVAGLLDTFDEGSYTLAGIDIVGLRDAELARLRREKIGFIFQSFNLIGDLDVYDNIDIPLRYRGLSAHERNERIESALIRVGLIARRNNRPAQLSGGQQQRVAIARALAGSPALILADEPTGNLDSMMARQILELLHEINTQGTTVVMVTHATELAARAHRKLHILDGRVIDPWAKKRALAR